ncbi:MAG: hypothetical protein ABL994_21055 [Verrucomicrobiales bacterium]
MIAEDGRQLLASNLDVKRLAIARRPGEREDVVVSALEAHALFGLDAIQNTPLSSWARMSATFPFITPPGAFLVPTVVIREEEEESDRSVLWPGNTLRVSSPEMDAGAPGWKTLHLLDAGYADNYGTRIALDWLREYWLPWLQEENSRAPKNVLLIELDAYPRYGDESWHFGKAPQRRSVWQTFWDEVRKRSGEVKDLVAEDAGVPSSGLGQHWQLVGLRNEEAVEALNTSIDQVRNYQVTSGNVRFRVVRFVNPVRASLSWTLSNQERETLNSLAGQLAGFVKGPGFNPSEPDEQLRHHLWRESELSPVAAAASSTIDDLLSLEYFWQSVFHELTH